MRHSGGFLGVFSGSVWDRPGPSQAVLEAPGRAQQGSKRLLEWSASNSARRVEQRDLLSPSGGWNLLDTCLVPFGGRLGPSNAVLEIPGRAQQGPKRARERALLIPPSGVEPRALFLFLFFFCICLSFLFSTEHTKRRPAQKACSTGADGHPARQREFYKSSTLQLQLTTRKQDPSALST